MGETVRRIDRRQSRASGPATCSSPTIRIAAARTCPTSPSSRRCTTRTDRIAVLHRQPRASCRDRRHRARLDAAVLEEPGRRRRADPQFQAGRRRHGRAATSCARCCSPAAIRRAPSRTTWPTSRPRSPPISTAPATCCGWSSATRSPVVEAYMRHIQAAAERKVRLALARLPAGPLSVRRSPRRRHADRRDDHDRRRLGHDRLHRHRPGAARAI